MHAPYPAAAGALPPTPSAARPDRACMQLHGGQP